MDLKDEHLSTKAWQLWSATARLWSPPSGPDWPGELSRTSDSTGMTEARKMFYMATKANTCIRRGRHGRPAAHSRHRRRYDDEQPSSVTSPTIDSAFRARARHSIISVTRTAPIPRASFLLEAAEVKSATTCNHISIMRYPAMSWGGS